TENDSRPGSTRRVDRDAPSPGCPPMINNDSRQSYVFGAAGVPGPHQATWRFRHLGSTSPPAGALMATDVMLMTMNLPPALTGPGVPEDVTKSHDPLHPGCARLPGPARPGGRRIVLHPPGGRDLRPQVRHCTDAGCLPAETGRERGSRDHGCQ